MVANMMDQALRYHGLGWSIFPLGPRDKRPDFPLLPRTEEGKATWEPFKVKQADESQIKAWWKEHPLANIGVVTGAISGIVVMDMDSMASAHEIDLRGGHDITPMAKTSKGFHVYFKHPGITLPNFAKKISDLDFRGDGGYVAAPPSIHPSGWVYAWEFDPSEMPLACPPKWLIELAKRPVYVLPDADRPVTQEKHAAYASAAIMGELAVVKSAQPGSRNDTLYKSAFKLGTLIGAGELSRTEVEQALIGTAGAIGLTQGETTATVKSGIEDGIANPRTIPEGRVHQGVTLRHDPVIAGEANEEILSIFDVATGARSSAEAWGRDPQPVRGYKMGIAELDEKLGGLLPNDLVVILGRTGSGKSTWAMQVACSLATQGAGEIFTTEMTPEWYVHRMAAYWQGINAKMIWTGKAASDPTLFRQYDRAGKLPIEFYRYDAPGPDRVIKHAERIKANGGKWIILDSIQNSTRAKAGGIYDRTVYIMEALRYVARDIGLLVIATCQANRGPADRKEKEPLISDAEGGGVIEHGATRFLTIYRPGYDIETGQSKSNEPIDINTVYFRIAKDRHFSAQGERVEAYFLPGKGFHKREVQPSMIGNIHLGR